MAAPTTIALQPRACEVCQQRDRDELRRCSSCQVVYYCGRDHQAVHRPEHKKICKAIKKARDTYVKEETDLRNHPGDIFTPPCLFETSAGHFWGIVETRPYMRARFAVVDTTLRSFGAPGGKFDVVEAALDHLLDMLRLCRGDNMGVRDIIPALFIRLGRDQEAYDFVKWYATTAQDLHYDWGNLDLPFLDVKNADVLEAPFRPWKGRYILLSHSLSALLIKVRILLDLIASQNAARAFRGTVPPEVIDLVRIQLVGSVVLSRPKLLRASLEVTLKRVVKLKSQVRRLYKAIDRYSPHFWPGLLGNDVEVLAASRPDAYSPGDATEACLMIGYNYAAWIETPGALEMMRDLAGLA